MSGVNTTGTEISLVLTLPLSTPARLQLVDVAGRQLAASDVENAEAGSRRAVLETPAGLRPGHYWVRLTQSGKSAMARVVFVR
ncbi:MAG: hypothetical protein E6J87_16850 [Deltaproteobacteria bacterium]|nr:MAG: hypothetical protein E6J87_16850 [Deltaproteobacteria bacterium]